MSPESFFKDINNHYSNKFPFVVYKKGNQNQISAYLQEDNKLYKLKDFTECGFVMAPFNLEESSYIIPQNRSKNIEITHIFESVFKESKSIANEDAYSKQDHLKLISNAIKTIENENLEKVVVTRQETLKGINYDPIELFKRLITNYPEAFVYCWFHPEIGLWLGATPETLLNIENNRFSTMSLAGTKAYQDHLNINWSDKEINEQSIVTNFIVNQLNNEIQKIQMSEVETIKAGSLVHLRTQISGVFSDKTSDLKTIVNKLHPTPAVCGFPKDIAKNFIIENENYNREFYTGFLGELNIRKNKSRNSNRRNIENNAYKSLKRVTDLYVNLRCMKFDDSQVNLFIGGGITIDSNAEQEWQETVAKSRTIKKVL